MQGQTMSNTFVRSLNIRCAFSLARLLAVGEDREELESLLIDDGPKSDAFSLGLSSSNDDVPPLFLGTPLAFAWQCGRDERVDQEVSVGSREEWETLSQAEQCAEWEDFHDRCRAGTADEMYFYSVMMDMHLVGYVGD